MPDREDVRGRMEPRQQPGIAVDFPAIVRGRDVRGRRFERHAQVCNVSSRGLTMRPLHGVTVGMKLFIVFRFAATWEQTGLTVAANSIVQRVERDAGKSAVNGVRAQVGFQRYRCLHIAKLDAAP